MHATSIAVIFVWILPAMRIPNMFRRTCLQTVLRTLHCQHEPAGAEEGLQFGRNRRTAFKLKMQNGTCTGIHSKLCVVE